MKVSYNWLKKYIDLENTPDEIAEILTDTGLEVEKLYKTETVPGGLKGIVVGEVIKKEKHPNADKLSVAQVDIGADDLLNIVCGASNLAEGQKVPVATVGATIHPINGEPFTIKKAKLRGEASFGMICAEDEIGLGTGHEGIMVLDSSIEKGTPLSDVFEIEDDYVFEIGLTPNRSDAMSLIGVAKDIAAALNAKDGKKRTVNIPTVKATFNQKNKRIQVQVNDLSACARYSGITLKNIDVKESPDWIKNSLLAVDVRPINNVVDITNYVLKEYGQPLHAFDIDAIKDNQIIVRKAQEGETFVTLDNVERTLRSDDLVICDAQEPMCIAGVFGGAKSGVMAYTKGIFLESAYFDSKTIRKTSTHFDLRTDAAQRYEKGADPTITVQALKRAVDLLIQYANAEIESEIIDIYPQEIAPAKVTLDILKLNKLAGHTFYVKQVKSILTDLDFTIVSEKDTVLELIVPLYRADVTRPADVIEEVMRIFGFNNIDTPNTVRSTLSFTEGNDLHQAKEQIAYILNGMGYSEIMTNSITQSKYYSDDDAIIKLQNSMTKELDSMRLSLVPEALNVIQHNINRKQANLKFYEFGNIYFPQRNQKEMLNLYLTGDASVQNWANKATKSSAFHIKGAVDAFFQRIGLDKLKIIQDNDVLYYAIRKTNIAKLYQLNKSHKKMFDINQDVFVAEIEWDEIAKRLKHHSIQFSSSSKFPQVSRDLAIILDENLKFVEIEQKINHLNNKFLKKINLFDIFRDEKKIGKNKKSYALSFTLQHSDKTLTDKEIDLFINKVIRVVEKEFNAEIRK